MGRPKQTVSHQHIRKILEALLPTKPTLKRMLEHMRSNLYHRGQLLEGPAAEVIYCSLHKLNENVKERELTIAAVVQF